MVGWFPKTGNENTMGSSGNRGVYFYINTIHYIFLASCLMRLPIILAAEGDGGLGRPQKGSRSPICS